MIVQDTESDSFSIRDQRIHDVTITDYYTYSSGTVHSHLKISEVAKEEGLYRFWVEESATPKSVTDNIPTYAIRTTEGNGSGANLSLVGTRSVLMYVNINTDTTGTITHYKGTILDSSTCIGSIRVFGCYIYTVVTDGVAKSYTDGILGNYTRAALWNTLRFKGAVSSTFDGTEATTVTIPNASASCISYTEAQTLTDTQKEQARNNIGVEPLTWGTFTD